MFAGLSPARRRVVLGLAALLVLVAAAVGTAVVLGNRDEPASPGASAQERPGPVLLVPGYGGNTAVLRPLADRLALEGRDATVVQVPGSGTGDLAESAVALDEAVTAALARTGAESVDIIGYSAGGLIARLWVSGAGSDRVRRVVTLGSPHHGTDLAGLAGSVLPGQCPLACQQMDPASDLLAELNTDDETPDAAGWVSFWTTQDRTVTPPDSARLAGALNVAVQSVCADAVVSHNGLPTDPLVQAMVLAELGAGDVVELGPDDCADLRDGAPA
ncbi:lipase family alpha/beta hydrolase [Blastococcus atacamensis]|uniref:lipase family alpha/beta hydrolase n=1 Tax=Blastococcus atacamensis TaxID=2070508 RepID=UPI000CEBBF80|nr:alpha/beta fold hydrolase [Blastococcus atacamensis]